MLELTINCECKICGEPVEVNPMDFMNLTQCEATRHVRRRSLLTIMKDLAKIVACHSEIATGAEHGIP